MTETGGRRIRPTPHTQRGLPLNSVCFAGLLLEGRSSKVDMADLDCFQRTLLSWCATRRVDPGTQLLPPLRAYLSFCFHTTKQDGQRERWRGARIEDSELSKDDARGKTWTSMFMALIAVDHTRGGHQRPYALRADGG